MNIENELLPGEELLYSSKAHPNKVKKNLIGYLIILVFLIGWSALWFMSGNRVMAAIVVGAMLFFMVPYFLIMIKHMLKFFRSKNDEYFVTNKRIIISGPKIGTMIYSVFSLKMVQYQLFNKGEYGFFQLYYDLNFNSSQEAPENLAEMKNYMKNLYRASSNDDAMCFMIGIEEPEKLIQVIKNLNPNVSFEQTMTVKNENNNGQ